METEKKEGGIFKSVAAVFLISIFCRLFGFLREIVIANHFGTGTEADAYMMAIRIFNIFALLFGSVLTTSYTPLYTHHYAKNDHRKSADRLTSNLLNIIIIVSVSVTIFCEIFTEPLCTLIATGFSGETFNTTVNMCRIVFSALPFYALYYFFSAVLNAQKHFKIVEFATMFVGFGVVISVVLLTPVLGEYSMPVGALLAYVLQFIVLIPSLRKNYKYVPVLTVRDSSAKEFFRIVMPSVIGVAAAEINSAIDSALASEMFEGSVAAINYAQRINTFATSLLITPIITVMFTKFSQAVTEKKEEELSDSIRDGFETISLLCFPLVSLVIASCSDVISIVYERGAFDDVSVDMTSTALMFYIAGLVFYGYKTLMNRAFYARKNTKTPMWTGIIYIVFNIVLNFILAKIMGLGGLALANSIALLLATIVMIAVYVKQYGKWSMKGSFREFAVMILGTVLCVLVYFGVKFLMPDNLYIRFFIPCIAAVAVYAAVCRLFKVRQFMELWNMIVSKFKKK